MEELRYTYHFLKDTKQSLLLFALLALPGISCVYRQGATAPIAFQTWDEAVAFLQVRHLIPEGQANLECCKADSIVNNVTVCGNAFRIIALNYRGSSEFGIRGQNGPLYVFLRANDAYKLVGGFQGNRVDIVAEDGRPVAKVHTHISAWESFFQDFPFHNGVFNQINPNAKGDVFK